MIGPSSSAPAAAIPAGERVYAIGDVHGRAELFAALIAAIEADDGARLAARTTIILLGDLIDRGPDSAGVIRLARAWQGRRTVRILIGNHEEMFLGALEQDEVMRHFLRFGGREMLLSYPLDQVAYDRAVLAEIAELARASIPADDIAFLRGGEDQITIGDYLFVHAGIRPGIALSEQRTSDLRWIREDFLDYGESFGPIVIHGHSISDGADIRHNRIGIDTGAYRSGRLTALGLEGTNRWLLTSVAEDGAVRVKTEE
jgi:serine/threonine protein phosphatase 1